MSNVDQRFLPYTFQALVTLLASLSPSVIPEHLCPAEEGGRKWHVGAKSCVLLKKLPRPNRTAAVYICRYGWAHFGHNKREHFAYAEDTCPVDFLMLQRYGLSGWARTKTCRRRTVEKAWSMSPRVVL